MDAARGPFVAFHALEGVIAGCDEAGGPVAGLVDLVAADPAFPAGVLRLANSPPYGYGGRIASLPGAVVLVEVAAVRNLA